MEYRKTAVAILKSDLGAEEKFDPSRLDETAGPHSCSVTFGMSWPMYREPLTAKC